MDRACLLWISSLVLGIFPFGTMKTICKNKLDGRRPHSWIPLSTLQQNGASPLLSSFSSSEILHPPTRTPRLILGDGPHHLLSRYALRRCTMILNAGRHTQSQNRDLRRQNRHALSRKLRTDRFLNDIDATGRITPCSHTNVLTKVIK